MKLSQACPCGLNTYQACCGIYHSGQALAPNAEKLMRSRYSAYVLKNESYLLKTWQKDQRPAAPLFEPSDKTQWLELIVKNFNESSDKKSATVEFIAVYKLNGKAYRLHEISRFIIEDGQWVYVDGSFPDIK